MPRGLRDKDPARRLSFTAILFNACFANLFDSEAAIAHTAVLLAPNGRVVIRHPLGSGFVAGLNAGQPDIVPHLLPTRSETKRYARLSDLRLDRLEDEEDDYPVILKSH